ncbi:mitochondrial import receptor subunit TOM20 homolog B [Lepeophtheirus salmonis]|uniref:Mitochondrial import receptor subunit TOM20 homolog n=1 Tax=Lepeophtheirus salmonis TaxID=72036 RepID=D3PGG5_LEPSM|nr:mitochondrial import receptor subunit TOM20 homolog B-like [Lepeophtheirus salmonis]ADD24361.1 Mitochondrial import receptor subunit TOM20 homolog [Lepeophtheirus salmonis]ADD24421.1 Mitochondrial import receptor subunit TOM20 homolog [Lepeophtheirus salmonis]
MVSSTQIGVGLGLSAAAFLGYCLYFDNRRRRAPDFRQKLREKRRAAAKKAKYGEGTSDIELPDFSDHEAVQRFFLREVQTGEDLLGQGNITKGVEHLSLAVAVCGQPHALLGVLQQTLPNHIYSLLLQNLDIAQKRVRSHATTSIKGLIKNSPSQGPMNEEDLE